MDLLTVVGHEVGHLLGYDHSENAYDVMAATLGVGTRRIPGSETPVLQNSWELVVSSSLLDFASRWTGAQHELVARPLLARAENAGTGADTEAWLLPLVPEDSVIQPGTSVDRLTARILKAVANEETELLDEELLDLLVAGQK